MRKKTAKAWLDNIAEWTGIGDAVKMTQDLEKSGEVSYLASTVHDDEEEEEEEELTNDNEASYSIAVFCCIFFVLYVIIYCDVSQSININLFFYSFYVVCFSATAHAGE